MSIEDSHCKKGGKNSVLSVEADGQAIFTKYKGTGYCQEIKQILERGYIILDPIS